MSGVAGYALATPDEEVIGLHLPAGGEATVLLGTGRYSVDWYNPRTRQPLQKGSVLVVTGPGQKSIGRPPADGDRDWAVILSR